MAQVELSLYRLLKRRTLFVLATVFLLIGLCLMLLLEVLNQSSVEKSLVLKHRMVEQALSSYLVRAEGEMRFIGQNLSYADYEPDRELDMLFSHHDVLFRGGLDFFYIDWLNAKPSMDPRARLFTKVDFPPLLKKGLINRWVPVLTQDEATLLMRKQPLISSERETVGFLYGFISLNDNLTLANELLESASLSSVQIVDLNSNHILLQESRVGVDLSASVLRSRLPLTSAVYADLQLEIMQKHGFTSAVVMNSLPLLAAVFFIISGGYLVLMRLVKVSVFAPIEKVMCGESEALSPFSELSSIQRQSRQYKSSIEAKERRFSLLTESIECAVLFCNEVAEIELINTEASTLFPEASRSRTLFDFMPILCHQSIQEALRGGVGITFDLTISNVGLIYQWKACPFENESGYRSVLFVGRNITRETSLTWQLAQLTPLSSAIEKKVDTDALLSELSYLSVLPGLTDARALQGWLLLLTEVLHDISCDDDAVSYVPMGEVIRQESTRVMSAMGIESSRALLDCTVESSVKVVAVDRNTRHLIRILLMSVMSNDMAERRLKVAFDGSEWELTAISDSAIRPLFHWVITMLIAPLNGQLKTLQNHTLKLNFHLEEHAAMPVVSLANKVVAWLVNDYYRADVVTESLARLGVQVIVYASNDGFFTQSGAISQFDTVMIGCDQDVKAQSDMTRALKLKYHRDDLPIVWLNSALLVDTDPDVFALQGCVFDYSLYQVLERSCALESMVTSQLNTQGQFWLMIGGSRVVKAVWYNELERSNVTTQWLTDLSHYHVTLSYHTETTVVLLEPQPAELLRTIQSAFPKVRFFSLQRWSEMPDNVTLFEMSWPYSGDQIQAFTQNVMQQTIVQQTVANDKNGE